MERIYSNKIWMPFLLYMEREYGKELVAKVLQEVGVDRLELSDPNGFQTDEFASRLTGAAIRHTGNAEISYRAGRALLDSLGKVGGFVIGLTSPSMCMKLMGQTEGKLALKTITKTELVGKNQYRVSISFRDGFQESLYACQNRIGSYEAVPRAFGLPFAKVEHPTCVFRGQEQCEYLVTIPEHRFIVFQKAALALGLAALVFGGTAWALSSWAILWGGALCLMGGLACFAFFKHQQSKNSQQWILLANEGLAQQNRELAQNNTEINSLQSLTLALGHSVRVQQICNGIVETLVRDFGFGSSQIWLLDDDRKFLVNRAAHGYTPELAAFIRNTRFEMGRDWDNPYGLLVQTMEKGNTLLVNDVEDATAKLSNRTREFIQALRPTSFIMTPLFHGKAPIGLLTAEHHRGQKLDNQDKLLFQSISNIVANALIKAELFESMEQKIDQRSRELEAANRQLMTAKEMAIQSEKLSSLGQMAAGVAHEINNPLNFLVNILPDVRRDVEGLERIRALALGGEGDLAARVREVDGKYDLESHLSEKDFVFDRIGKALEKSTRIANSLKVFSRSSAKERVARESLSGMVKEVIDLLPQKVRGDTAIDVDVAPELEWSVNKNEMEQAFLAIINNAIDAMDQKGRLRIRAGSANGGLMLAFEDEGPGIPPEALKKIFDPFYTTKPPGKGTGLGLTIASEIVKKYGGNLAVDSRPGKGTTFSIHFDKAHG